MSDSRLTDLLHSYFEGKATDEETEELMSELENPDREQEIKAVMERVWEEYSANKTVFSVEKSKSILAGILKVHSLPEYKKAKKKWRWTYAGAAAVVVLLGSAVIFQLTFKKADFPDIAKSNPGIEKKKIEKQDIGPGGNKAILTLDNGSSIVLDSMGNGTLAQQGNSTITKSGGHLLYGSGKTLAAETPYNTLTTPNGGQYQLTLADGSDVWLNAASSIRFPVSFTGKERSVEVTGEVYFEVAKNANKPFKVLLNGMEITVLGTHFNVNGYADEPATTTTLLEGSVKIIKGTAAVVLAPGQQAKLTGNGKVILIRDPDVEKAVSWKEGYFHFNNNDLETVLRELSRWYDFDIVYENEGKKLEYYFSGDIGKSLNLSAVLRVLEKSQVHFRIEGKKLIVMP